MDVAFRGRVRGRTARIVILDATTHRVFPLAVPYEYPLESTESVTRCVERAGWILNTYAQPYLGWVNDAVHALVPIRRPAPDSYQSGSANGLHGVVYVSAPVEPLKVAELLIHESSHQGPQHLQD